MDKLSQLLKQVSEIVVREKTQQKEKQKRGENFNIFRVLGLSTSEVKLHSAFLAELLNPTGDHGLGSKFLEAFVDNIVSDDKKFPFEYVSAKVYVELDIGPIRNDENEGGRIDIYIQDKNKKTIVIENKIYAGDQYKQMLRYYNYVTKNEHLDYEKNQFRLLYLTLDEHVPSQESTGNNKLVESSIKSINYKDHILTWLERCIEISALYPSIREILSQYVINLKQILNIMSDENRKEFIDYLTKDENIDAALDIMCAQTEICKKVWRIYIDKTLCAIANRFDLEITGTADFVDGGGKLSFTPKDDKGNQKSTRFILENKNGLIWYYFICQDKKKDKALIEVDPSRKKEGQEGYPYGWKYIGEKGSNRNGWEDWYSLSTIKQLVEESRKEYSVLKNDNNTIAKEIIDQLKNFGFNEMTS